jgi:hypothetical protein
MVYEFVGLLVESYGTWLLLQRLVDASKDSDIPKNVPFAFAINNRNTKSRQQSLRPTSSSTASRSRPRCVQAGGRRSLGGKGGARQVNS